VGGGPSLPAARKSIGVQVRFLTFFYFLNVFFILKNVGKVQSGKQINKKHFQNNSNETDL